MSKMFGSVDFCALHSPLRGSRRLLPPNPRFPLRSASPRLVPQRACCREQGTCWVSKMFGSAIFCALHSPSRGNRGLPLPNPRFPLRSAFSCGGLVAATKDCVRCLTLPINCLCTSFTSARLSGAAAPEPPLPAALGFLLRRACCREQASVTLELALTRARLLVNGWLLV